MGEILQEPASDEPLEPGVGTSEGNGDPEPIGADEGPLTRKETLALIADAEERSVKRSTSVSQSLVDKADHRISGRLQSDLEILATHVADLAKAGHVVPAEVVERAKQDVILRSLTSEPTKGGKTSEGKTGPEGEPGEIDSAQQATGMVAIAMMEEADCFIEDKDPEIEMVDMRTKSSSKFILSVDTAIKAKQKRLAASEEEPEGDEDLDEKDRKRKARSPRGTGGKKRAAATSDEDLSAMDYLKRGYSESK